MLNILKDEISSNILVVDDLMENIEAIKLVLKPIRANLLTATSGEACISLAIRNPIALILLDVQMPTMDGFETATLLRNNEETKNIPIIFATAISKEEQYIQQGYQSGGIDYIVKPIDPDILLSKVTIFLALHQEKIKTEQYSQKYQMILNSAGEGICGIDNSGIINFSNPAAEKMLGFNKNGLNGELFANTWANMESHDIQTAWKNHKIVQQCKLGKIYHSDQEYFIHKTNGSFPVEYTATPILSNGHYSGSVVVFGDITKRKTLEKKLMQMGMYDSLTGLANRSYFNDHLKLLIAKSKRSKSSINLLFIDIDNFKKINDGYGHYVGDRILIELSQQIKDIVRETDLLARIGGDEFVLILEGIGIDKQAIEVANKIRKNIKKEYNINNNKIHITISIGIAGFPESANNANELIQNADMAMYAAKKEGKNSVTYFNNEMKKISRKRLTIENDLYNAIENNEFQLYLQPQVSLNNNKIIGFEALLRWHNSRIGQVPPDEFIPIAEESGMIFEITYWVIEAANKLMNTLSEKLDISHLKFAINISPHLIGQKEFPEYFSNIISKYHNKPEQFDIEITETAIVKNLALAENILSELSALGSSVSIDDFGTGYSSLYQLKRLPVNSLKIDKSFVSDIVNGINDFKIVNAIIQLANNLNLSVIAEGIETVEQLKYIKEKGCTLGQGYYYSKPKPLDDIAHMLNSSMILGGDGNEII